MNDIFSSLAKLQTSIIMYSPLYSFYLIGPLKEILQQRRITRSLEF